MINRALSKREIECLVWVSRGKTSYETGKILGIAEQVVKNYLTTIKKKLNASNRTHAVVIALENQLLS